MVTSTDSGLSVPDWPTTYGWNMFTFPMSKWVGGIRYEHSHRLIASTVGFLTIILAGWTWWVDPRRWVRRLGFAALGAVIVQGLLGGLTVLFFLPAPISIGHAGLAQIFFCLTLTLAVVTSPGWKNATAPVDDAMLRRVAAVTTVLDLHADSRRRHDAAHGCRAGDSRFPLRVRPRHSAGVERAGRDSLRAPRRRADRHAGDPRDGERTSSTTTAGGASWSARRCCC